MGKPAVAAKSKHDVHVGSFDQSEIVVFDKRTVRTDVPEPALRQLETFMRKQYLYVWLCRPTRTCTTVG